jgi:hypothetical protein
MVAAFLISNPWSGIIRIDDAAASAVGSNPVNNTIRFIVQPILIFYDGVCRIRAYAYIAITFSKS